MADIGVDDLDAVKAVIEALKPFEPKDQERIMRWVREKLGLTQVLDAPKPTLTMRADEKTPLNPGDERPKDIKSFVALKSPQSDNQFAATVAYFYRFEAPEVERKASITPEDLQDATRKAGRDRLATPSKTLMNAHGQGYFDKAERGHYALSTVGENLVAMALPQGAGNSIRRPAKSKRRAKPKKKK